MKTLSQLLALGLCLFTFSNVVAQNDSTNDHWRNSGINTWTQPARSVGIGTNAPKEILHIQGGTTHGLTFKSTGNGWGTIGNNWGEGGKITAGTANMLQFTSNGEILFRVNTLANNTWRCLMRIKSDGRVAIGADGNFNVAQDLMETTAGADITDYKLFVKDGILTEKVKVAISTNDDWSDYVFEEGYERMPLDELEDFVTENKHLPKVPSAEEMVENGLDVAKMDAKLLEKIEEAYLYIIDLNKKVDALATENEGLKTSLQSLSTSGN